MRDAGAVTACELSPMPWASTSGFSDASSVHTLPASRIPLPDPPPELVSKPSLLSLRVAPGRHHDRFPQIPLRKPPCEHRSHLSISHPVEPRGVRRHARRQDPPQLVHQAPREHLVHALSDATVQHVPWQRELNVPRPHRPGLAGVLLPPAEAPPREQRDLDGPPRPLSPAPREPAGASRPPVGEPPRRQRPRPRTQPLASRRVERGP